MNHKNRGIALIFSFERLDFDPRLKIENGFAVDVEALKKSFRNLGFDVHKYSNLNYSNFEEIIDSYSQRDFTDDDCFVCAIVGHGDAVEQVNCADHKGYVIENLFKIFGDVVSLQSKPKVFIINMCRGERLVGLGKIKSDENVGSKMNDEWGLNPPKEKGDPTNISQDIFKFYTTIRGYFAAFSNTSGSFTLNKFCEHLDNFAAKKSLTEIFTNVQRELSNKVRIIEIDENTYKFYTVMDQSNTGRRKVIFYDKKKLN